MDKDFARFITNSAARAANELANVGPNVRRNCNDEEHEKIMMGLGRAIDEIYSGIIKPLYAEHPDLEAEADVRREKFGCGYY